MMRMRCFQWLCGLILGFSFLSGYAQSGSESYWQQEVHYRIDVELDDVNHMLTGFIEIDYINHSPDSLNFIYFHLWPNAYNSTTTEFAKQQIENGSSSFQAANAEKRGALTDLNWKADGNELLWHYYYGYEDVARVILNDAIYTGDTVTLYTPFKVDIPSSFSRLGHVGQSYQVTQWFPKPAVYDKEGWHEMYYLDQGEFYSEFGSFDVKITLPANYVVGATGDLQTAEELEWLNQKAEATVQIAEFDRSDMSFPVSDSKTKTLHYKASDVHDFAWFADKRYHVLKGEVELPGSGRKVTSWAMFTNNEADLWLKSIEYLNDATYYYSDWVGDYPYNQVTAVDGALSAGAGMEYPMITVIGQSGTAKYLELVIMHEVGHNWFYGVLGTNERAYPWMDEGINSYYENRYMETKYPNLKMVPFLEDKRLGKMFDLRQYEHSYASELLYLFNARRGLDQPICAHSEEHTHSNYGSMVYSKAAIAFQYLEAYLRENTFDEIMQQYYTDWQFKHPQPADLEALFETSTGKNLDWFFTDVLCTDKKSDYAIAAAGEDEDGSWAVRIENKGEINGPVHVAAIKDYKVVKSQWIDGFADGQMVWFEAGDYDLFRIDPHHDMTEFRRDNNSWYLDKAMHRVEPIRFQFLGSIENPYKSQVHFMPAIGWNNYDKTMLGIALYNNFIPSKAFEYQLIPMFATGSKNFTYTGRLGYHFYPKRVQEVSAYVSSSRFSQLLFPDNLLWHKFEPKVVLDLKKKTPRSPISHRLTFRAPTIVQQFFVSLDANDIDRYVYSALELGYRFKNDRLYHPYSANAYMRIGRGYTDISAEVDFNISYARPKKGIHVRFFAGGFVNNDVSPIDASPLLPRKVLSGSTNIGIPQFQRDYLFDEVYIDRNAFDPVFSKQVAITEGGFVSNTAIGTTANWLATINLAADLPGKIPIRVFANGGNYAQQVRDGITGETRVENANVVAETGFTIVGYPNVFEIHVPVVTTTNIKDNQETALGLDKFYEKITFTLNLKLLQPFDRIRELDF